MYHLASFFLATKLVYSSSSSDALKTKENFPRKVVIVKYGGSAITYKSKFESINAEALEKTSSQLKLIIQDEENSPMFIIIHGAGSFGHFQASKYNLSRGGQAETWLEGFSLTRQSVVKLNGIVVGAHIDQGIPAVGVSLFPYIHKKKTEINVNTSPLKVVEDILASGLVPVLHGDGIVNESQRCSIFSGDHIMSWLCENIQGKYRPTHAVFLTDVLGVFDKNPIHSDAKLIRNLYVEKNGSVTTALDLECAAHDVTGGIKTKIDSAVRIAKTGVVVYIVQAGTESAFQALRGEEPAVGTRIILRK